MVHLLLTILYPDGPYQVSATKICEWAEDKYNDNADWHQCSICGNDISVCNHNADTKPVSEDPYPWNLQTSCKYLEDKGYVTFKR